MLTLIDLILLLSLAALLISAWVCAVHVRRLICRGRGAPSVASRPGANLAKTLARLDTTMPKELA